MKKDFDSSVWRGSLLRTHIAGHMAPRRPALDAYGLGLRSPGVLFTWKLLALVILIFSTANASERYVPAKWTVFVKVEGQSEPVPEQWLQDAEARIAYGIKLPDSANKWTPFDFNAAYRKSWIPGNPTVAIQYFKHLCSTEAGEWIFRKADNVEGLYFARPQGEPTSDLMADPYGPEMPWIQRRFMLQADTLHDQGTAFIQPPLYNYRFVEQPHRPVEWQKSTTAPYVRLFGYTRERARDQSGRLTVHLIQREPMQFVGIPAPTARYGYTWRGIKRARDRENGIAGGELLIYVLQTKEVLAVRRQFLITRRNPRSEGKATWEIAASCPQVQAHPDVGEFSQFAFDVLQTHKPSATRRSGP
jgi:hypothetical protein